MQLMENCWDTVEDNLTLPSQMKFADVHHVAIIGSDYERSKHFDVDILGFSILHETYWWASPSGLYPDHKSVIPGLGSGQT